MLQQLKKLLREDIIKVFSLTAVSTVIKMLTGLMTVKIVAVIIGPSGLALLGQLNNFVVLVLNVANGGINTGITKYVAENERDKEKIKTILSTALKITLCCSFFVALALLFLSHYLSEIILNDSRYFYVFLIFGFSVLFYSLNLMIISIINGFKEFKTYVYVNIAGSILGLIFTILLVLTMDLAGALISVVAVQSIVFLATLFFTRKLYWFSWDYFKEKYDQDTAKKYLKYSLMTLTTVITVPLVQLILRGYVITNISLIEAGYWEAMNRLSGMYLLIITSSFSVYYLPKLSEIKDNTLLREEIIRAYKLIIPVLSVGLLLVYLLRFFIIDMVFTSEFRPMSELFFWQLTGDFFKIASWLLAFLMLAKSMTKMYILTEIIFSLNFLVLSFILLENSGVIGIVQGYMLNYIAYMIFMVFIFRKLLFYRSKINGRDDCF